MPIFDFRCSGCGIKFETLFLAGEEVVDSAACPDCDSHSDRVKVGRFRIVGPVFEDMERYESALLSKAQRKAGARFKSGKEIQKWEDERGLSRMSHGSSEYNQYVEKNLHEARTMSSVKQTDGRRGVADWIEKTETLESTSLSNSQYSRYKERSDAVESNAPAASID